MLSAGTGQLARHRQVFFSRMTTSRSGLPVMGSLYFAHTPYTLHRSIWI